jgi:hypothetical protein
VSSPLLLEATSTLNQNGIARRAEPQLRKGLCERKDGQRVHKPKATHEPTVWRTMK